MKSPYRIALLTLAVWQVFSASVGAAPAKRIRVTPLSGEEKADLAFMREEEKLARDVYLAMAEKWKVRVFSNIARSEQTHMDSIASLLARYGVADPVAGMPAGQFATETFQTLYTQLIERGSQSLQAALEVGALIEETDIVDLWERTDAATHADIIQVYQNLESASENHLRAFVAQLAGLGIAYEPVHLTPGRYEAIINP